MLCSELHLVKLDGDGELLKPLPCNRWSCDWCAPARRRRLLALAASGEPNRMLTLTVNPKLGDSPNDRRNLLHDAWKRLVKRILRFYGWKELHYMAFLERTKRGEPHLHILLRCGYISQRWLSRQMQQMIAAPIVWIERIKGTRHAIKYVTKYVTKAPAQFGKGKRYWVSRKWEVNKPDKVAREPFNWRTTSVVRERWSELVQVRVAARWTWEDRGDGWYYFYKPGYHEGKSGLIPKTTGGMYGSR